MVKIRLTQTGKRNRRMYRLIVTEKTRQRDGKALEIVGYYNPTMKPPQLEIKRDRISFWIGKGAQMTETVKKLAGM